MPRPRTREETRHGLAIVAAALAVGAVGGGLTAGLEVAIEGSEDLLIPFLTRQRVVEDDRPVQFGIDVDSGDRHEREPLVVDAHQLA